MSNTYDFKTLSPEDFERLTADLLSRLWECHIESFRTGRDKGVDLRASFNQFGVDKTVIQCKRFDPDAFNRLMRVVTREEIPKVEKLAPASMYW